MVYPMGTLARFGFLGAIVAVVAAGFAVVTPSVVQAAKTLKKTMNIQEVKSPGGITAWLVEERSVPLIAMRFAFEGGSAQDPTGREGVANFMTAMMDEGAGDLDAAAFQEQAEDIAMRMSFSDGRDNFYGSFQTLSKNLEPASELLRLAITNPRFDTSSMERIRAQLLTSLAFAAKNPNRVCRQNMGRNGVPGPPLRAFEFGYG